MEKKTTPVISAFIVIVSYLFIRYPLFPYHGMKQLPLILAAVSMVIVVAANFCKGINTKSILISIGYILGFAVGLIFKTETVGPNGRESNLFVIWLCVYVIFLISGIVADIIIYKKKNKE